MPRWTIVVRAAGEPADVPVVPVVVPAGGVAGGVPGLVVVLGGVVDAVDWPVAGVVVPVPVVGVAGLPGPTCTGGAGTRAGTQSSRRDPVSCRPASVPVPAVMRYRYQIGAPASTAGRNEVRATVTDPAFVLTTSVPVVTPSAMLPGVCKSTATATVPPSATIWAVPWALNSIPTSGLVRVT